MLLDLSSRGNLFLLGLFSGLPFLSFPQWLNMATSVLTCGLQCPFLFTWAYPAHLLPLNFLGPFTNFASHGHLLTQLGFPGPISSFSSLGLISLPLSPTFFVYITSGLPRLIFTFPYHILPMGIVFFLSGPFRPT